MCSTDIIENVDRFFHCLVGGGVWRAKITENIGPFSHVLVGGDNSSHIVLQGGYLRALLMHVILGKPIYSVISRIVLLDVYFGVSFNGSFR